MACLQWLAKCKRRGYLSGVAAAVYESWLGMKACLAESWRENNERNGVETSRRLPAGYLGGYSSSAISNDAGQLYRWLGGVKWLA
jgi:hypothetical protein